MTILRVIRLPNYIPPQTINTSTNQKTSRIICAAKDTTHEEAKLLCSLLRGRQLLANPHAVRGVLLLRLMRAGLAIGCRGLLVAVSPSGGGGGSRGGVSGGTSLAVGGVRAGTGSRALSGGLLLHGCGGTTGGGSGIILLLQDLYMIKQLMSTMLSQTQEGNKLNTNIRQTRKDKPQVDQLEFTASYTEVLARKLSEFHHRPDTTRNEGG